MSKLSHTRHFSKRQSAGTNPGCNSGAFYKSPKQGDNIDTSQSINIQWDTSLNCFSTAGVDIYLYAPYATKSMVHAWGAVSYSAGSFQTPLVGSWWNSSTAPIQLQLGFVEAGTPSFLSPVPPGPLFTSTFNSTDFALKNPTGASSTSSNTSSNASGGGIFQSIGNAYQNSGLPKGSIAAAVIVPLIAVAIGVAIYVKFQRAKEAEKRRRWSQAVDKRMSAISSEWKGLPPNAQSEAIRQSIAIMRNSRASVARMSQVYGDEGRPTSTYSNVSGGGAAGIGARKGTGVGLRNPSMASADTGQRKSTVSFAADTRFSRPSSDVPDVPKVIPRPSQERLRPSTETQRGRASRAFHTAISASYPDDVDALMSPTQKGGPTMVDEKDIKQLELGKDESVFPALSMIQHEDPSPVDSDFLSLAHSSMNTSESPIASPPATLLTPTSATPFTNATPYSPSYANTQASPALVPSRSNPFAGFTRGPSNMMSPDAMLRAYATRDGSSSAPGTPMAVAQPFPPPPSAQTYFYPALDAPAQPEPVSSIDAAQSLPPAYGGRTLYAPGQERHSVVNAENRYSTTNFDDAYSGFGKAA